MRIQKIIWQNRRDFSAYMVCEGCGVVEEWKDCYDDDYYHNAVIPTKKCKSCGKSRNDLGIVGKPTKTKYEAWEVV